LIKRNSGTAVSVQLAANSNGVTLRRLMVAAGPAKISNPVTDTTPRAAPIGRPIKINPTTPAKPQAPMTTLPIGQRLLACTRNQPVNSNKTTQNQDREAER